MTFDDVSFENAIPRLGAKYTDSAFVLQLASYESYHDLLCFEETDICMTNLAMKLILSEYLE